jgi:hypothetical protein
MDYRSEAAAQFPFQNVDHLAWAKRILYREERKDSHLMSIQVQFARMALGLIKPPGQK